MTLLDQATVDAQVYVAPDPEAVRRQPRLELASPAQAPAPAPAPSSSPAIPRPRSPRSPTPVVDALRTHLGRGTVAFSSPGHKGGAGADPALRDLLGAETFSSDVWLDPATYETARREAEARIASVWGADHAFIMVNGSTSANQALLLATLHPGDTVVCARDAHVSTHTGLMLTGARPVWVSPRHDPSWDLGTGITPEALDDALAANPAARMALVVSPSYSGICSDLPRLAAVAHRRGVPFVVDEAWGPHLRFGSAAGLPIDALTAGADAVITSTHTMLSSLSQSAVLLVRGGRIPVERVAAAVRLTQTTSPYLPLVASVDSCRAQLEDDGPALVGWAVELARLARTLLARVPGLRVLEADDLDLSGRSPTYSGLDLCKIVVDVRGRGIDGLAADRTLREVHGIAPEGSDAGRLYLVVGPGDSVASVRRLVLALAAVGSPGHPHRPATGVLPALAEQVVTPREAYFAAQERVPLEAAAGRVCAELVTPYPPGIPVLAPGERVSRVAVIWLQQALSVGLHVHGPDDPTLQSLRVLA